MRYVALALGTIGLGLAVHRGGGDLQADVRDVLGDALWAAMIFWLVSAVAPAARLGVRTASALAICMAVELGQLVSHPLLNAARRTTIGHLVLGTDFDARDLVAYAAGGLSAALLAFLARRRTRRPM